MSKTIYMFDLEVKGQCRIGIMNARDTSPHGDTTLCQIWLANFKPIRSYEPNTKTCQKLYKFDPEVKGQRLIVIINVRDTSSHGDIPMCQIW